MLVTDPVLVGYPVIGVCVFCLQADCVVTDPVLVGCPVIGVCVFCLQADCVDC